MNIRDEQFVERVIPTLTIAYNIPNSDMTISPFWGIFMFDGSIE